MKILIYGINYAPEPTGIGKYTAQLAEWLAQSHSVECVVGKPYYPSWSIDSRYSQRVFMTESYSGLQVHRSPIMLRKMNPSGVVGRVLLETSFAWTSSRFWFPILLRRRKFDVVIAILPPLQLTVLPLLYQFLRGVPCVLHVQDLQVDAAVQLGFFKNPVLRRMLLMGEAFLAKRATMVSTITEAMKNKIAVKGIPLDEIVVFPNWSDDNVSSEPDGDSFRLKWGIGRDKTLVMYAGSMGAKQGLEVGVLAAELLKADPKIHFMFVGDGPWKEKLLNASRDKDLPVSFLPVQPEDQLPSMLAAADIHLVIQRRAAADLVMPSKLVNILAAGRPAVVTAEPSTTLYSVVTSNELGIVCEPEDPQALADSIKLLSDDEKLRMKFSKNASRFASENLSKNSILKRFEQELMRLSINR